MVLSDFEQRFTNVSKEAEKSEITTIEQTYRLLYKWNDFE